MPIPTEVVGSLPRPQCPFSFPHHPIISPQPDAPLSLPKGTQPLTAQPDLQKAYADYDAGTISRDELVEAQDKAAEDSVTKMSQTGETLVTDGEQRASSFATYPIIDTLGGKGLADNLAADGQYFVRSFLLRPMLSYPSAERDRDDCVCRTGANAIWVGSGDLRRRPSQAIAPSQERSFEVQDICV